MAQRKQRKRLRTNSKNSIDDEEKAKTTTQTPSNHYKLNIGGTTYGVSNSLLDQFPDSMLRKITSDTWTKATAAATTTNSASEDDLANPEIFIDRNGERFQYVLDYMRDGKVSLPLSVPRASLIADMEYFGIDYDDDHVTLSVADPKDLFHGLGRYRDFFDARKLDIEERYRKVATEKLACDIAATYFSQLVHTPQKSAQVASYGTIVSDTKCDKKGICFFQQFTVNVCPPKDFRDLTIDELQPYLKEFGLQGTSIGSYYSSNYNNEEFPVSVSLLTSTNQE